MQKHCGEKKGGGGGRVALKNQLFYFNSFVFVDLFVFAFPVRRIYSGWISLMEIVEGPFERVGGGVEKEYGGGGGGSLLTLFISKVFL